MQRDPAPQLFNLAIHAMLMLLLMFTYPIFWTSLASIGTATILFTALLCTTLLTPWLTGLALEERPSRITLGALMILASSVWFVAPYRFFDYWAVNSRLVDDAISVLFRGFRLNYDHDYMAVLALNLFWFMLFAIGIATCRSSSVWRQLFSATKSSKDPDRSSSRVFGTARWGKWSSIRNHVEDPNGIVLGEDYNPLENKRVYSERDSKSWGRGGRADLITMSTGLNGGHVNVFSGTGGGKTAGIVIPTAYTYNHPIIFLDVADEIHKKVSKARADKGFKARVIEPGKGIDLIKLLEPFLKTQDKTFFTLAHALMAPTKELTSDGGRYFTEEAGILAAGLLKHLYMKGEGDLFGAFARILSKNETDLKKYFKEAVAEYPLGEMVPNFLGSYSEADSRTFTSLQSTARQALIWASFDKFGDILSSEPSDAADPLGPKTDIYIKLSMSDIHDFPTIVRLIFATLIFIVEEKKGVGERLMIIDEAYQVGRLKQFELVRDTMRKRGLHIMQIFQSEGQLEELYGRAGVKAWNSSIAARVYTSTEDEDAQKRISQVLGNYTVDVQSQSKAKSSKSFGMDLGSVSQTESLGLQGVPLLRPEEIRQLPDDAQIIFFKGQAPILCGKAFSWRRKEWQQYTPYMVNGKVVKL